jgi:hypothetical protein
MNYFENPSISGSDLAGCRSAAEFYQRKFLHKKIQADYFDIGTAAHAFILQTDKFHDMIFIPLEWPDPDNKNIDGTYTKKGANGKYFDRIKSEHPDKIVFEPVIFQNVIDYAESVKKIPGFDKFINFETGLAEQEYFTKDEESGLELKGMIDYVKPGKFLADLKFSKSISDRDVAKDFYEFEYHLRAAFYLDLYNKCTGENLNTFIYVCVEKSETPVARFLKMAEIDINAGRSMYRDRLNVIAECFKTGEWILSSIENYQLPEWVYTKQLNF